MNELLIKLGKIIKQKRKDIGISQENFAYKIGMDRTYYSSIENGKHNISILQIEKIANGLDITISELLQDLK